MNLSDIKDKAGDVFSDPTFKSIMVPAMVGAAGTGALTSFAASRNRDPRETPSARRRRLMLNAMAGAGLGGLAGAALPAGIQVLRKPLEGRGGMPLFERGVDATVDTALGNAAAVGTGVLGSAYVAKNVRGNRDAAINRIASLMAGDKEKPDKALERARSMLANPEGRKGVLVELLRKGNAGKPGQANVFQFNELLQEAGLPGFTMKELQQSAYHAPVKVNLHETFKRHLADQGPVSRMVSGLAGKPPGRALVPKGRVAELLNKVPGLGKYKGIPTNPSRAAELYSRFIRPSVGRMTGRVAPIAQLGLLGGGMLGADYLQDKLTGK